MKLPRSWELALRGEGLERDDPLIVAVGDYSTRLATIVPRSFLAPFAEEGSQIERDDDREWARRHGDLTVHHQAQVRLAAAASHLRSHAQAYLGVGVPSGFYHHAEFSVLRGALECTALARWLLEPAASDQRVLRALMAKRSDGAYEAQAADRGQVGKGSSTKAAPGKEWKGGLSKLLKEAAQEVGHNPPNTVPNSSTLVDKCPPTTQTAPRNETVGFQWRVCSSYAHGYDWADWHMRKGEARSPVPHLGLAVAFVTACQALQSVWVERWLPLSLADPEREVPEEFLALWPVLSGGFLRGGRRVER